MKKVTVILLICSLFGLVLAGCSSKNENTAPTNSGQSNQPENDDPKEAFVPNGGDPVTITVFQHLTALSDEEFEKFFIEPVQNVYSNVTLELVRKQEDLSIEDMIAAGEIPDMIFASALDIDRYSEFDLLSDLNSLIKKHNLDESQFAPGAFESLRAYGKNGETYGIPLFVNYSALFYNKDIFDKFAVEYPKDGMTWQDVAALTRKLSRTSDGIEYHGFDMPPLGRVGVSLMLPLVDPETDKVLVNGPEWKEMLQLYENLYTIPGNQSPVNAMNGFMNEQIVAMVAAYGGWVGRLENMHQEGNPMNWDMVQYPLHPSGKAEVGDGIPSLMITTTSEKKDDAFAVIEVLTSMENQLAAAKDGRKPVLKGQELREVFGENLESLKGKNVDALFKYNLGELKNPSGYDTLIKRLMNRTANQLIEGEKDINTLLREAEEEGNQLIEGAKGIE